MRPDQTKTIIGLTVGIVAFWPMWHFVGAVGLFTPSWGAAVTVYSLRFSLLLGPIAYGYEIVRPVYEPIPPPSGTPALEMDSVTGSGSDNQARQPHVGPAAQSSQTEDWIRSFIPTAKLLWKISFAVAAVIGVLAAIATLFLAWAFGTLAL